jgi:hypothetical protein
MNAKRRFAEDRDAELQSLSRKLERLNLLARDAGTESGARALGEAGELQRLREALQWDIDSLGWAADGREWDGLAGHVERALRDLKRALDTALERAPGAGRDGHGGRVMLAPSGNGLGQGPEA